MNHTWWNFCRSILNSQYYPLVASRRLGSWFRMGCFFRWLINKKRGLLFDRDVCIPLWIHSLLGFALCPIPQIVSTSRQSWWQTNFGFEFQRIYLPLANKKSKQPAVIYEYRKSRHHLATTTSVNGRNFWIGGASIRKKIPAIDPWLEKGFPFGLLMVCSEKILK